MSSAERRRGTIESLPHHPSNPAPAFFTSSHRRKSPQIRTGAGRGRHKPQSLSVEGYLSTSLPSLHLLLLIVYNQRSSLIIIHPCLSSCTPTLGTLGGKLVMIISVPLRLSITHRSVYVREECRVSPYYMYMYLTSEASSKLLMLARDVVMLCII